MDKIQFFNALKSKLVEVGLRVNPPRDIQYGLQSMIFLGDDSGLIRVYEGKKGVRLDLSQLAQHSALYKKISDVAKQLTVDLVPVSTSRVKTDRIIPDTTGDPDELIGVDESGKGDYFGPLVVAGVHINPDVADALQKIGVRDSKLLSPKQIDELEKQISEIAYYSVVILNNIVYNDVYTKFPNLNNLLAWGHGRVIENMLGQVTCNHALCDQFGHQSLIQNALILRGIDIKLLQRPRAEDNIGVAAASILARSAYLKCMDELSEKFKIKFPRGCPPEAGAVKSQFIQQYGESRLAEVAKLHFKV